MISKQSNLSHCQKSGPSKNCEYNNDLAYKVKGYRFNYRNAKFRYHPEPEEDELLSSWIIRLALAHHTDPATFVNLYLPAWKNSLWMDDVDVSAENELIEALALKSGYSHELIRGLTLKSYEGYLAERITCKSRNPFIQSLGRQCRVKVNFGLRFCPACLREDVLPYFRKRWRLSFSTACVKHKCFIIDRCPECGAALNPYRSVRILLRSDMMHCYTCGADLRKAAPEPVQDGSYGLWAIQRLYEILQTGIYTYAGGYSYSFSFFEVLRLFVRIVYFWGRDKGFLDHEVMREMIYFRSPILRNDLLENIPLKEQYLLFSGLLRLFDGFPGRVLSFCGSNKLRGSDLTRDMRRIPFWYQKIADAFDMQWPQVSLDEVRSVIEHLKRERIIINKTNVGRIMGLSPDFKKRKDIAALFLVQNETSVKFRVFPLV